MNERIRELKYQAEALAYEEHKANCIKNGRDPSMPHANALNMTFEKFAELIIQDTVQKCCQYLTKTGRHYAREQLERHFGVEE